MKNLIIEQIEQRARLEHDGNFSKAADEYFRDHRTIIGRKTVKWRRAEDDRKRINAQLKYRTEEIAYGEKLDLNTPADLAACTGKSFGRGSGFV